MNEQKQENIEKTRERSTTEKDIGKKLSREERMRRRRRQIRIQRMIAGILLLVVLIGLGSGLRRFLMSGTSRKNYGNVQKPDIDEQFLTINEYSRPGLAAGTITGVVVHYTANPGTTAQENRNYFENLKDTHLTKASSNFIVGLDGEIIQCVPVNEVAYASNDRNYDTVSIECCHPDDTGKFTDATYQSLVQLTAWLCSEFGFGEDSVIRHYDVTGKLCPKYFVEHEDAWELFREDVGAMLGKGL